MTSNEDRDTPADAPQRRPGGRSARVKEAVHRAVLDAVAEHGVDQIGIPDIARRAGIRDSSLYRRWGTRENLVLDALLGYSEQVLPIPDTGTLRGDLTAFATELAAYLATPLGHGVARALAYVTDTGSITEARHAFWAERYRLVEPILARAADRGELPPGTDARMALELLIAPIHFRAMLTREPADTDYIDRLAGYVTRALGPDPAPG
ncbi:TetR/AcrR family transcriptional regulator [Nocardia sp. NPDC004711]